MNYNYNHLFYFYIAAKSGGITAAAEHLHISQPSLSSQLKVLEESLDVKLFEKVGRKNQLTPTGTMVYGYCRQMFELAEKMTEVVTKSTPTAKRKIQIGVSDEVEKEFVTEIVSEFLSKYPVGERPQVQLASGKINQLLDHLHFKEIDTIITAQNIDDSEFVNLAQVKVPVVLCCSSKWNNPNCPSLEGMNNEKVIEELAKCNDVQWILPSSNFELRSQTDHFFEKNQIEKRVVFESDSISALVRSVHNELGFSFLPLPHVASEIRGKYLKRLGLYEGFWDYSMTLGCHAHNKDDSLIRNFSKAFKDLCEEVNPPAKPSGPFIEPIQINA
ncbi:MAG: LysR family transcriptional regulator [Bacteriovorax sp.]